MNKDQAHLVVLIDDNPWEAQYAELVLRQSPLVHSCRLFDNGWDALLFLDLCKSRQSFPSLLLVDLQMEGMDGFQFIEHFENTYRAQFPYCGIVILTNSQRDQDLERAGRYDSVRAVLPKPLTLEYLRECLTPSA